MTTLLVAIGVPLYFLGFVWTARQVAWEIHDRDGLVDDYDKLFALACGFAFPLYWLTLGVFRGIK